MRKMKDSGIVRLGLMPEKWTASRVKYIYSAIGSGTTPSSGKSQYYDGSENWIQSGDLYKTKYVIKTEKTVTDFAVSTISALHKYKADFVIIAMYGASIGNVAISKIDACVNQACCVIKPNSKMDFNYLYYTLVNDKDIMLDMSIGGTQPNISQAKILELPVFLPPIDEQKKIADFLDEKCGEIDSIHSDIQKQIDILNDYKKSVITEAVTKGLNPKAKLKDSGIEWIGKIPEDWTFKRIKYLFKEVSIPCVHGDDYTLLSVSEYYGVAPRGEKIEEGDNLTRADSLDGYKICEPGDIVMNIMLAWKRALGVSNYLGIVSPAYCVYRSINPSVTDSRYYHYLFRTDLYADVFRQNSRGIIDSRLRLYPDKFFGLSCHIPPLSEQKAIADYLDEKCSEIDATIVDKQRQLETLDEYKKSLIFEYVTGKKEVIA